MAATLTPEPPGLDVRDRVVLPELRPWVWPWLTPYQREGIAFAAGRRNAHLWWSCGAGKTAAAIAWAVAEPGPVLCITRACARRQWASEVRRFSTVEPYVVLPASAQGVGTEPMEAYLQRCEEGGSRPFVIMGWDTLHDDVLYERLATLLPRMSLIFDEIHEAKDYRRFDPDPVRTADGGVLMRFKRRATIAARAAFLSPKAIRRLGLTATAIPNRIRDLWAVLDLVEPGCAGKFWDFARRFCAAVEGDFGWITDGASNLDDLRLLAEPRAHVVRSEEVHALLPALRRTTTFLSPEDLSRSDAEASAEIRRAARWAGGGSGTEGSSRKTALLEARLVQAAARKVKYVSTAVCDAMASGQKVLIFTGRRRDVETLRERIVATMQRDWPALRPGVGSGWKVWAADGSTPPDERETIRDEYMAHRGPACIVGTGDSWGESVNLNDTDRLIVVLLPWTWGQIRQWEGRVRRLGMSRPCLVEYVVAVGTIDERISSVVLSKLGAIGEILPDEQIAEVRDAVRGGTVETILDGLLDRLLAAPEEGPA